MIKLNNNIIAVGHFPDGTQNIKFVNNDVYDENHISWFYDNDSEMFTLMCVMEHIKNVNPNAVNTLFLPYIPNGRMDRVKNKTENFSLKVFANFINSLGFTRVEVINHHSDVSMGLINNIVDRGIDNDIVAVLDRINVIDTVNIGQLTNISKKESFKDFLIFFPDEGACKRYSELFWVKKLKIPVAFGIKKRDWSTGEILSYDVIGDVEGKNILIVDDICSKGTTFYFAGKKLKELGAKKIDLYVTHCENTVREGKLLKDDSPICRIFTTNSICKISNGNNRVYVVNWLSK